MRKAYPRCFSGFTLAALAMAIITTTPADAQNAEKAWTALIEGGHVALIRHGNAPPGSGGDPPGFRIDDCATQRNLDEKGRAQATALGATFRDRGVHVGGIYASPWCRCMETARLMAFGTVESSWALVPSMGNNPERPAALKALMSRWRGPGTLVLVTHALTVQRLLGFLLDQAETLVLEPMPGSAVGARIVGTIAPPR